MPQDWVVSNGIREQPLQISPQTTSGIREQPITNQPSQVPLQDRVIEFLRPLAASALVGGGTAAAGPFGTAAGLGAAGATDMAIQSLLSRNQQQMNPQEAAVDTTKMLAGNELGGAVVRGLGGLLSKIPTAGRYRDAAANMLNKLTGRAPDTTPFALAENIQQDVESAKNFAQAAQQNLFRKDGLRQVLNNTVDDNSPVPFVHDIIADPKKLERTLIASNIKIPGTNGALQSTNIRQDLAGYQLTQLIKMGPKAALQELADPNKKEIYTQLYSQQTRANLEQLFKAGVGSEALEKTSRWIPRMLIGHGAWSIAPALISGHVTPYTEGGVALAGVTLGGMAINKIMQNTKLGRAMINLAEGVPAGMSDQAISRMLVGALQGTGIAIGLQDKNGNETKVTIESNDDGTARMVPLVKPGPSAARQAAVQTQIIP